jgi:hypothetical protein
MRSYQGDRADTAGTGNERPRSYSPLHGAIELRNVWFRYADAERFVLENNLSISPGNSSPSWAIRQRQNHFHENHSVKTKVILGGE